MNLSKPVKIKDEHDSDRQKNDKHSFLNHHISAEITGLNLIYLQWKLLNVLCLSIPGTKFQHAFTNSYSTISSSANRTVKSEEAQEARNKKYRKYREQHLRKFNRVATNIDVFDNMLVSSKNYKELFLQIVGNYPVVDDKKSDTYNIMRKKKAWDNITAEFNDVASKTIKLQLPEERRELMATGGGPAKPAHSPNPAVDKLVPYLEYKIDVRDDSDGIQLSQVQGI
nr:unnamed protein product [Callosobruchus chinensis]